jgi:KDO2-lipid IV(A) lauroyltransferase
MIMRWLLDSLLYLGARTALECGILAVKVLPRRVCLFSARVLGNIAFRFFRSFRKRSMDNLRHALGSQLDMGQIEGIARKSLENFLQDTLEVGFALAGSSEEIRSKMPIFGKEHLDQALARGKGVIALSAHLGNFFLVGSRISAEGYPVSVLVKPAWNDRFSELMDRYRLSLGQKTIPAKPRLTAARQLIQVLRHNQLAVVIADEYRSKGIPVRFFGRLVLARRGPVTLAMRTGAAIVPSYLIRDQNGQLTLIIEPELELSRTGDLTQDVASNTLLLASWLERAVRSYPDQWNWMTVRWREDLRDEPAHYYGKNVLRNKKLKRPLQKRPVRDAEVR